MGYDPFRPGPHRVTVNEGFLADIERDKRRVEFRSWHPVGAAPGPLILYSHASYGHGEEATYLRRHLASHGYVVAAADHAGNTRAEGNRPRTTPPTPAERDALIARIVGDRVPDIRLLLDSALAAFADQIDTARIGLVGWSFGGWAALATLEHDDRFSAVVAFAPAGASNPLPGIIPATLTFKWKRDVPALYLAADHDRFIPLAGVRELYARTPSSKRLFVLAGADHGHFADEFESAETTSAEHAHLFARALTLAHFDAVLRGNVLASRFLGADAVAALRARGVIALAV